VSPAVIEQFARLFFDLIGSVVMMFITAFAESLLGGLKEFLLGALSGRSA
jgi:hypothetical protein